ncbi:putative rna 2'-phosphotransferase 1 [Gossypium arboreum]|uniref:Putative rna 2'-phosphotransferase 1 n=1 Tax=Gossypium arboreum TaxID=29729 RepID=A0A0B0MF90_GOSAR|nr:putative rna 2'-phosphotransferase 1 [Gossypium arboreum]
MTSTTVPSTQQYESKRPKMGDKKTPTQPYNFNHHIDLRLTKFNPEHEHIFYSSRAREYAHTVLNTRFRTLSAT